MDFKEEIKEYANIINNELIKYVRKEDCPEKILNEAVEYSLITNAKRLRPMLMIATYKLFKPDYEKCFPFAVAMEMIHNFSLIHDDLPAIDNDDYRHGKLSNHKKFNEATAILAGDSLLNNAYIVISKGIIQSENEEKEVRIKSFGEFTEAVDRMIAGEYVDTEFEGKQISHEYLEYMNENKTGALIKTSVRIGAILAGASEKELINLTSYAEKIGLAFQIKDDILSEEGDFEKLGKPIGNDREKGKATFVTKYGLEKAKETLNKIIEEAKDELETFGESTEFLKSLANYIRDREK